MHRIVSACCSIAVGFSLLGSAWPGAADPHAAPPRSGGDRPAVSLDPDVVIVGAATPGERRRVDDAVAAFRDVGLALPDVEVRFDADQAACNDHYGLFQERFDPWRITICSDIGFVMLHEFGHAWERANLGLAERDAYAAERGFPTWNSVEFPRTDRAAEEAAFVLQQVLSRSSPPDNDRWRDLTAAYELLIQLAAT